MKPMLWSIHRLIKRTGSLLPLVDAYVLELNLTPGPGVLVQQNIQISSALLLLHIAAVTALRCLYLCLSGKKPS